MKKIPWNKGVHIWKDRKHPRGMKGKINTKESNLERSNSCKKWWDLHPQKKVEQGDRISGERNPNWNGGKKVNYPRDFINSRLEIIKEDERICQLCASRGDSVHHIDYNKENNSKENLVTLCKKCNTKVNKNREMWKNYFSNIRETYVLGRIFTRKNMDINSLGVRRKCGY